MGELYISKQKIVTNKKETVAYELIFKDYSNKPVGFANSLKSTSKLILSTIESSSLDKLLGKDTKAFINVDETTLTKGILDLLDTKRFVFNILEDIVLDDQVLRKIVAYKKRDLSFLLSILTLVQKCLSSFRDFLTI